MFTVGSIYRISHSNAGFTANRMDPNEPQGPTETIASFPRALAAVIDVWIDNGQLTHTRNARAAGSKDTYVWCELIARIEAVHVPAPENEDPVRADPVRGRLVSASGAVVRTGDMLVLGEATFLL